MQVTAEILRGWFDELNDGWFGGKLPVPRIETGRSRTRLGTMSCRRRGGQLSLKGLAGLLRRHSDYCIRISNYYDMTADEFRNVLMHEMIHYYISVSGIRDTSAHGPVFRRIMSEMNARGWHIEVRSSGAKTVAETSKHRVKRRIILVMTMCDGSQMLTVVNRKYVGRLEYMLRRLRNIERWSWHESSDEYFSQWPEVRTLRVRRLKPADFDNVRKLLEPLAHTLHNM